MDTQGEENDLTKLVREINESAAGLTLKLPSAPEFMCLMRCIDGKPVGYPIWKTFEHTETLNLKNETVSATLLSLSQKLKFLNPDPMKSTIIKLKSNNSTFNIYLPGKQDEWQYSFVVNFEKKDKVPISDEDRRDLILKIVKRLKKLDGFEEFMAKNVNEKEEITPSNKFYSEILEAISDELIKWDKKRISYHEKRLKREREILMKMIEEKKKEEEDVV